ncbi:MAG: nucleotide exchange factor GrpE [Prochlorococcaceae cyanobacterium]
MSGEATSSSSQVNHDAEGASDHPVDDLKGLRADAGQAEGEQVVAAAEADAFRAPQAEEGDAERPLLEAEIERLKAENESLRAQYMRIAADFDNFRKRLSRDQDDLKQQITCSTLSEVLPVVDNFDRARQQLNPEGEEALSLHRSYQGLYKQLVDVFKNLGVSPMRVEGEPFDPSLHEAVLREPSDEHPEDVVIAELQRGYHLDGRVLRHALVKVSMGPGPSSGDSPSPAGQDVQAD